MEAAPAPLLLCAVLLLSATTQALTGFGFGLVALAILGVWMDLRDASLLTAPAGLALNILLFLRLRKGFSHEGIVPLLLACVVGVPVGVWLLFSLGPRGLRVLVGGMMIATAVHRLWMARARHEVPWHPLKAGIPCGFLSGILGGAFGAGGPPVVSYLINRQIDRFQLVATVQVAAAVASSVRLVQFTAAGRYEEVSGWFLAGSLVAVLGGVQIGTWLLEKISDRTSRVAILSFLVVGGFYHLFQA